MRKNALLEMGITCGIEFESDRLAGGENLPPNILDNFTTTHDGSITTDVFALNVGAKNGIFIFQNIPGILPKNSYTIGTELVSRIINSRDENLFDIFNCLTTYLLGIGEQNNSERSGIHYHITMTSPPLGMIKNSLRLGRYFEALFFRLGGMGYTFRGIKNDSIYCRPITKCGPTCVKTASGFSQIFEIGRLLECKNSQDFWFLYSDTLEYNDQRYTPQRYTWINIFPLFQGKLHKGTIEFRNWNKTLNPLYIISTLKLCIAFVQICLEYSYKEIKELGIIGENSVYDPISDNELLSQIEFFRRFGGLSAQDVEILTNILLTTPPVRLEEKYVFSHVSKDRTFWKTIRSPYPEVNEKIFEPEYVDIHLLRGERGGIRAQRAPF